MFLTALNWGKTHDNFFLKCTHQEIISLPSKNVRLRILLDVCAEQKYLICSFDNSVNFPKLQHYLDFAMQNSHNSLLILTQTTVNLFIKNKLALAREYCAVWRRTVTNQQQIHLTWCTQFKKGLIEFIATKFYSICYSSFYIPLFCVFLDGFHSRYLPGLTRRRRIATIDWRKDASMFYAIFWAHMLT